MVAEAETVSYRGRRIFQGAIALIGAAIMALAVYDLTQDHSLPVRESKLVESEVITGLNRFMDQAIGRLPIDLLMLSLGGWITFFGLHGVLHRGPQLRFGPDGVYYFRFGEQTIPWEAFVQIQFISRRRTSLLRSAAIDLTLEDPAPVAARQPPLYRAFRRTTHMFDPTKFTIHGYDIEVPLIRVVAEMQRVAEPESVAADEDGGEAA
ncbi:MAG: hypothetical protein QF893_08910 [Alphaproteobacteria bacterium]|jgi:hypothetical protein|nr:hypothetical protein [Alphaproteobacteria bacterium]